MTSNLDSAVGELAGLLWTWWRGDALPLLSLPDDLTITITTDHILLHMLSDEEPNEIEARIESQHQPYVAWLAGEPVAYGWSASGQTSFGSPTIEFYVPAANRYLLNFVTKPAWRGQGIYPCLLQAILAQEDPKVERFWILHQASNQASACGIAKAGFQPVGKIHFLHHGGLGILPIGNHLRAAAGANLLGVPLVDQM